MTSRCWHGQDCHRYHHGNCRFYHSPPRRTQTCNHNRTRSRSRSNTNRTQNRPHQQDNRQNLTEKADHKEQEDATNANTLQFMTHDGGANWGQITMKQLSHGLEMTSCSHFPTRMGRCNLKAGKYYYEVILQTKSCNARLGWALHSQKIDDEKDFRTGNDPKGWAYNGMRGDKFWNKNESSYGRTWNADHTGDVVSCAIDIDQKIIRYYLNGIDLGIAFTGFDTSEGIAPSISLCTGDKIVVTTDKRNFKYNVPAHYRSIETGIQVTWSAIVERVSIELGARCGRALKQSMHENIADQLSEQKLTHILKTSQLNETEIARISQFVRQELEFLPTVDLNNHDFERILLMRGFKHCYVEKALQNVYPVVQENRLNELIAKCVEYQTKEAEQVQLSNWKNWDCLQVIEWINQINDRHFMRDEYSTFKNYLKMLKIDGAQLAKIYDLTLRLLTLNDASDREIMIASLDKLTQRQNTVNNPIEPPEEYLDPITAELMRDPVICVKSGHTYERESILKQIRLNGKDIFTRQRISELDLVPNRLVKDCIEKWVHKTSHKK